LFIVGYNAKKEDKQANKKKERKVYLYKKCSDIKKDQKNARTVFVKFLTNLFIF
jgi:hypothetical protein